MGRSALFHRLATHDAVHGRGGNVYSSHHGRPRPLIGWEQMVVDHAHVRHPRREHIQHLVEHHPAWNVFVHVLMVAGVAVLLLVPPLERWVNQQVMG